MLSIKLFSNAHAWDVRVFGIHWSVFEAGGGGGGDARDFFARDDARYTSFKAGGIFGRFRQIFKSAHLVGEFVDVLVAQPVLSVRVSEPPAVLSPVPVEIHLSRLPVPPQKTNGYTTRQIIFLFREFPFYGC